MRKTSALLIAVVLGATASLTASDPALATACPVLVAADAHRGGTEAWVENTRNAFRSARNAGALLWETDVQFSADDTPWIMHDDSVDRTTDGTGAVAGLTDAQMAGLRTADGQPVPMLADLVNDAYVDGATLFPELKTAPTEAQWARLETALAARPMASKIVLTSFDGPTLLSAAAHLPQYRRGLIAELGDQTVSSVTQYAATILVKHHNAITWSRLNVWQTGGLQVYSWTVDSESEWDRMNNYPVGWLDGVITDDPVAYIAWGKARTC